MEIKLNLTKRQVLILNKTIADTARNSEFNTVSEDKISSLSESEKNYYHDLIDIYNKLVLNIQYQGGL